MFDPEVMQILGLNLMAGRSPNFAENLGNAGLATVQFQRQREEDKLRREEREFLKQQREMQMAQMKREQQFRDALTQGFRPGIAADPLTPMDDEGNPMPSSRPTMDFSRAMQIDPFAAMRAQEQFRNMNKPPAPVAVAEGASLVNPLTGQPVFQNPKKEKPKFVRGDTREYKSGGLVYTQEFDGENWKTIAKTPQFKPDGPEKPPAAPPGYQWTPEGGLKPIPGGPADYKAGKEAEATARRQEGALARAASVKEAVQLAIQQTNRFTTGAGSDTAARLGVTPAVNLRRTLDQIKANIGFQELQAMREASPTGGALGQVAVQELNMLQSVLGSLDASQSADQLTRSLNKVYDHFTKWERAVKAAQQQPSGQPSIDALVEQYGGK